MLEARCVVLCCVLLEKRKRRKKRKMETKASPISTTKTTLQELKAKKDACLWLRDVLSQKIRV